MHIHTHAHSYQRIHTHVHTHALSYTHIHINAFTHMHFHTHTFTHMHFYTFTPTYIFTFIRTHIHSHTYVHTHIHTYTCTFVHTFTHAYKHIHIHTYLHTHIHTFTPWLSSLSLWISWPSLQSSGVGGGCLLGAPAAYPDGPVLTLWRPLISWALVTPLGLPWSPGVGSSAYTHKMIQNQAIIPSAVLSVEPAASPSSTWELVGNADSQAPRSWISSSGTAQQSVSLASPPGDSDAAAMWVISQVPCSPQQTPPWACYPPYLLQPLYPLVGQQIILQWSR